jgi:hypothetical protein
MDRLLLFYKLIVQELIILFTENYTH